MNTSKPQIKSQSPSKSNFPPSSSSTISPVNHTHHCRCSTKFANIFQQISVIRNQIAFIFGVLQVKDQDEGLEKIIVKQNMEKVKNQAEIANGKNGAQESFLLDGIKNQVGDKYGINYQYFEMGNSSLWIGKQVAALKSKIKQLEHQSLSFAKIKTNFSLMTKIIQQLQQKFQNFINKTQIKDQTESTINQKIVNQNKSIIQSIKRSTISPKNKQKDGQKINEKENDKQIKELEHRWKTTAESDKDSHPKAKEKCKIEKMHSKNRQ